MKLKVLKCFVDKVNGKNYNIGDEIEVSDKRGSEILSHPLEIAEKIAEPKKAESEEKPKKKKTDSE